MTGNKKADQTQRPLFKAKVPRMPEGYYSGEKPNPNLRRFVEDHLKERLYDPENDDYDVPAFSVDKVRWFYIALIWGMRCDRVVAC